MPLDCWMFYAVSFAYLISAFYVGVLGQITVTVTASSNPAKNGSEETLLCEFTRVSSIDLFFMGFAKGDETDVTGSSVIAQYYDGDENVIRNVSYGEPGDYTMSKPNFEALQGSSTLTISSIALNDIGTYWCSLSDGVLGDDTFVTIDVFVSPSSVEISTSSGTFDPGDLAEVIEGNSYTFSCKTIGVRPEAIFQWQLENVEQTANDQSNQPNGDDNRLYDSTSSLILEPSFGMNKNRLSCSASVQADQSTTADGHVLLDVKVPPRNNSVYLSDPSRRYIDGSSVSVNENETHMLTCEVEGTRPAATFAWEIKPELQENEFEISPPLSPTPSDTLVNSSQTLTLLKPHRSHHKAKVQCNASIDVESPPPVTKSVTLLVNGPPDQPVITGNTNMIENITEELVCNAKGAFPKGEMQWFNDNMNITQNEAKNILDEDNRYTIQSIINISPTKADNGNSIECEVIHPNLNGQELTVTVEINVKYSPYNVVVLQMPDNPVREGDQVNLTCSADANPIAKEFRWFKDESDNDIGTGGDTLFFRNITRENDGSYTCNASNAIGIGGVSNPKNVIVYYPPEDVEIIKSRDGAVTEEDELNLTCSSQGKPNSDKFSWMKDGTPVSNEKNMQLMFPSIKKEQAGNYQCNASNGIGSGDESEEVSVIVYYSADVTSQNSIVSVDEGKNASLECIAIGHPEPNITWNYANGDTIKPTERIKIREITLGVGDINGTMKMSVLEIEGVSPDSDYVIYICKASNDIGFDTHSINLTGLGRPLPAKNVHIDQEESTMTTLSVKWTKNHNGESAQWFVIKYSQESGGIPMDPDIVYEGAEMNYTHIIRNLKPGLAYEVIVISGNKIGNNTSADSPTARGITQPKSPDDLGIIMQYKPGQRTLRVDNLPADSDESHCLQLEANKGNGEWSDLECVYEEQTDMRVEEAVDQIRGRYCVERVCGEATDADIINASPSDGNPNTGLIVGASIAGVILVTIIICLAVYLFRTSPSPSRKDGETRNRMVELTTSNGTGSGVSNPVSSTAEVPTYAQVNKRDGDKGNGEEDAYDDVQNLQPVTSHNDGKTVNPDGLIYQEVGHFKSHPTDAPPIQTEASTDYAALDFNVMKTGKK